MPMCGFNKKMLEGLTAFSEGLVEHGLQYKSKKRGETIKQGINKEISDMTRLQLELPRINDNAKRLLTEGLVKYAQAFYIIMNEKGIDNYQDDIQKIVNYFRAMNDKFYSELEGKPGDMRDLIKFLDEREI